MAISRDVIAWPERLKINMMHGDSQGEGIGVFGDYQFTGSLLSIFSSPPIREEPAFASLCLLSIQADDYASWY